MVGVVPMSNQEFRWKIDHIGRVTYSELKISTGVFFGLAGLCFVGRITIRLVTRKRLFLDDYLLIAAFSTLCAATVILHKTLMLLMISSAIPQAPELMRTSAIQPWISKLNDKALPRNTYVCLAWTTIFMVKFTFFAFFRPLIRSFRCLNIYYWCCLGFTIMAYGLSLSEGFVINRFNEWPTEAPHRNWYKVGLAMIIAIALADIISDAMIVSIPFLLLRNSMMKMSTKIGVGSFLSLSIFMIICSIIRAAGVVPGNSHIPDIAWRVLWQELEACIAVIMASITAFRTLLVSRRGTEEGPRTPYSSERWYAKYYPAKRHPKTDSHEDNNGFIKLPILPPATFTGVHPQIRKKHHYETVDTINESEFDPEEGDYHARIRANPQDPQ